ncbi:MAG: macro domain-containing protein, partial [Lachnospiraceae bacterium]|nr:macro domain-containing protein [Lachnospiraceae bacterium]
MLKIVRNDITKMECEAIVNTANEAPIIGAGCDMAIYEAAGKEELLEARKKIGYLEEGEAAITPGFQLKADYIIHAVSPLYEEGSTFVEKKLRACYKNSLSLAKEHHISSIAFPLIATGSFGYSKEEGLRIAVDEINGFLLREDMEVYLVVFSDEVKSLVDKIAPDIKEYIDRY